MSKKWIPAVGYLRRSTEKQEGSIEDQKAAIEKYAAEKGYRIIRWYMDDGISGDATEKRLGFLRMIDDARELQDFEAILCWDDCRFGRFDSIEAGYYIYPLRRMGVYLDTVMGGKVDWNDSTGRIVGNVKQEGKHEQLLDLAKNVVRGQLEAANAGSWIATCPYAYRLEGKRKNKQLVLGDPDQQETVKRIFREFVEESRSLTSIAKRLTADKVPTPSGRKPRWRYDSVQGILENPVYAGDFMAGRWSYGKYRTIRGGQNTKVAPSDPKRSRKPESEWIIKLNHHEALIEREMFDRAQALLARGKTGRSRHTPDTNPYLLSGLLRCGKCGRPLHGMDSRKHLYYECSHYKREGKAACEGTTVREDKILDSLAEHLRREYPFPQELHERAERGVLQPRDLPKSFDKLKRLVLAPEPAGADPKIIDRQVRKLDSDLTKLRRNLAYLNDPKNIEAAEGEIRSVESRRASLLSEVRQSARPSEKDANAFVISLLTKFAMLQLSLNLLKSKDGTQAAMGRRSKSLQRLLRDIEAIKVYTEKVGRGTRTRHKFIRGEIQLKSVGVVTVRVNPHLPG